MNLSEVYQLARATRQFSVPCVDFNTACMDYVDSMTAQILRLRLYNNPAVIASVDSFRLMNKRDSYVTYITGAYDLIESASRLCRYTWYNVTLTFREDSVYVVFYSLVEGIHLTKVHVSLRDKGEVV